MQLRPMTVVDWPDVRRIFAAGIAGGNATFEVEPPSWEQFDAAKLPDHRMVAVEPGDGGAADRVLGWIAVSLTSSRVVYSGVVEVSVYVDPAATRRGVGRALLAAVMASTEAAGIWTLQAGIFPENTASLALHRTAGFRTVGTRERMGFGGGRWRDVVLLERRSGLS